MRKFFISIYCIGILISGCKQIQMWKYGITNPKIETPESILKFAKEYNLDIDHVFIIKDSNSYLSIMKDTLLKRNLLSVLFFNHDGSYIDYRKNGQCQWSGGAFLQHYSKDSIYSIDSAFNLTRFGQKIIPLVRQEQNEDMNKSDLTIIIIWAKFLGKYNERLFCVSDVANSRQDLKTKMILLNMDMLEDWHLKKNQMLK